MAIEYSVIPYPDFKLHEIIEPDEFDFNNDALMKKIDEIIRVANQITDSVELGKSGADIISLTKIAPFASTKLQAFLSEVIAYLKAPTGSAFVGSASITGVTGATVFDQLKSLKALLDSEKVRVNDAILVERNRITSLQSDVAAEKMKTAKLQSDMLNHNHDGRYMTRTELAPYLQGGDTAVKIEVFTITNLNSAPGQFTYTNRAGDARVGTLGPAGEQIFTLEKGTYKRGLNYIEAVINDTLHRSVASGGLEETADNKFALTSPEGIGTEVTVKYFERVGVTGEHSISYGKVAPPPTTSSVMWFKELS